MSERGEPRGRDPSGTIGRNLEPFLLIELLRAPSYGYDLIRRLDDYGFRRAAKEPTVVYKVLRSLEEAGSIASQWSTEGSGPARRYYALTDDGRDLLRRRVRQLGRYRDRIDQLLQDYIHLTNEDPIAEQPGDDAELAEPVGATGRKARS